MTTIRSWSQQRKSIVTVRWIAQRKMSFLKLVLRNINVGRQGKSGPGKIHDSRLFIHTILTLHAEFMFKCCIAVLFPKSYYLKL